MIQKTFKQLREIDNIVGTLYQENKELQHTKFGYAYKRICEKFYIPAIKDFNEEISSARLNNALEDQKTKEVLVDKDYFRGYKYSKEGLKKLIIEENKIVDEWEEKLIDLEPMISSYVPEKLTEDQVEALTGVII